MHGLWYYDKLDWVGAKPPQVWGHGTAKRSDGKPTCCLDGDIADSSRLCLGNCAA